MTPFIFLAYFYLLAPPPPGTTLFSIPAATVDTFFSPANAIKNFTGLGFAAQTLATILGVIHTAEGLYTLSLCRRSVKGLAVTVSLSDKSLSLALRLYVQAVYVGCSMLFGVHIWKDLKIRIQEKRTEAATKFE